MTCNSHASPPLWYWNRKSDSRGTNSQPTHLIVSDLWLLGPTLTLHNYDSDLLTMNWNLEGSLLSCLPNQLSMSNLLEERFLGEIISALSGNSATLVAQEWKNYRERKWFSHQPGYTTIKGFSRGWVIIENFARLNIRWESVWCQYENLPFRDELAGSK